jgi:hypothetical protein
MKRRPILFLPGLELRPSTAIPTAPSWLLSRRLCLTLPLEGGLGVRSAATSTPLEEKWTMTLIRIIISSSMTARAASWIRRIRRIRRWYCCVMTRSCPATVSRFAVGDACSFWFRPVSVAPSGFWRISLHTVRYYFTVKHGYNMLPHRNHCCRYLDMKFECFDKCNDLFHEIPFSDSGIVSCVDGQSEQFYWTLSRGAEARGKETVLLSVLCYLPRP